MEAERIMDMGETLHSNREQSVCYNGTTIKANGQCMWDLKIKHGIYSSFFLKKCQKSVIFEGFLGFIIAR